jgi:hypothetical protein
VCDLWYNYYKSEFRTSGRLAVFCKCIVFISLNKLSPFVLKDSNTVVGLRPSCSVVGFLIVVRTDAPVQQLLKIPEAKRRSARGSGNQYGCSVWNGARARDCMDGHIASTTSLGRGLSLRLR